MADVSVGTFVRAKMVSWASKALGINLQPISGRSGWWTTIRESYTGAWQRNDEIRVDNVLTHGAVYACVTLIAADMSKMWFGLVEEDDNGIWTRTESPAFARFFRKPNRFQTLSKYVWQYTASKLIHGNTYVLLERDGRNVPVAGYVLDPTRVRPMVAPDGSVYYELKRDDLSGLAQDVVMVPANYIIHDVMNPLFHPLMGVSPIYACGLAALQGLSIQSNSSQLFTNGGKPGGVLSAPGAITQPTADRLKEYWDTNFTGENMGKVAVLGDGLHYEPMAFSSVDMQLIDQLKWTSEMVCSCFHVPAYMIGVGNPPPYANMEPLIQQYYSQCLQSLIKDMEDAHDVGLGLLETIQTDSGPRQLGSECDINDLIWMDTASRTKAAAESIGAGALSPDEARKDYFGKGPVTGGDTPYMQQQNFGLAALAKRDADDPFSKPAPAPAAPAVEADEDDDEMPMAASFAAALNTKLLEMDVLHG